MNVYVVFISITMLVLFFFFRVINFIFAWIKSVRIPSLEQSDYPIWPANRSPSIACSTSFVSHLLGIWCLWRTENVHTSRTHRKQSTKVRNCTIVSCMSTQYFQSTNFQPFPVKTMVSDSCLFSCFINKFYEFEVIKSFSIETVRFTHCSWTQIPRSRPVTKTSILMFYFSFLA